MDRGPDKKVIFVAVLMIALGLLVLPLISVFFIDEEYLATNNPVERTEFFNEDTSNYPTMLKADGTSLVDADGNAVVLKGVTTADPHRLDQTEKFSLEYYENVLKLGGNVIRIPVQPNRYVDDEYYMWRYLDLVVKWAGESNSYIIIDWACAGNPTNGGGDNMSGIAENVMDKSVDFWKQIAAHYKDTPNVIFEIYNEPIGVEGDEFIPYVNAFIEAIRSEGADQLIIVGSIDSGYDINWLNALEGDEKLVEDDNLAIGMQIFPYRTGYEKTIDSYELDMPLIVTAWGYGDDDLAVEQNFLSGSTDGFAVPLMECLNSRGISWVACYHDDSLEPTMYFKGTNDLTKFGKFIIEELKK